MAENKHQILAKQMQQMLQQITEHIENVKQHLNITTLIFFERDYIINRPLMKQNSLKAMFSAHYVALQNIAPSLEIKETCKTCHWIGAIIGQELIFKRNILHKQLTGYFIILTLR